MQKVRDALIIPRVLGIFGELSLPVFPYLVNMREAETEIKTTLENRSRARSHVIQAIAYEYQLDFTNAIYELENALAITPEDNNIKNSLELAQAMQLAQAERFAYPYVAEGARLLQAGRLEEAMAIFRYVPQFHPKSAMALYSLATIHDTRGEHAQAIEELMKAIEIDPGSVEARYSLAIVHIKMREYEQAELQLKEVLRIAPDFEAARAALENLKDTAR